MEEIEEMVEQLQLVAPPLNENGGNGISARAGCCSPSPVKMMEMVEQLRGLRNLHGTPSSKLKKNIAI